jgi:hypothetical protein
MPKQLKQPTEFFSPPTMVDSPDFTTEEAASAQALSDSQQLVERIALLSCHTCEERLEATGHTLRRLAGVHYSRVSLQCKNGHVENHVFRLDWLKGER